MCDKKKTDNFMYLCAGRTVQPEKILIFKMNEDVQLLEICNYSLPNFAEDFLPINLRVLQRLF